MVAAEPPGTRAIWARHLFVPTFETSMRYSRPLMVSSKRCTVTGGAWSDDGMCTGGHSLAARPRQTSERTAEGASTECMSRGSTEKSAKINKHCRCVHRSSTILPHLFNRHSFATFACRILRLAGAIVMALTWAGTSAAQAPVSGVSPNANPVGTPDASRQPTNTLLYRVFLQD